MTQKRRPKTKKIKEKVKKDRDQQEEKMFDFGGIPDRNLKKNLGCG